MKCNQMLSRACWATKALAMLFVVMAHTDYSLVQNPALSMLLERLGAVAVPVFLLLAGYFYHAEKSRSFWCLLKKKAVGLCLPWLFCGLLVYGYTALRAGSGFRFGAAIRFMLGNGSYLYYLTVLLALQLIFYFLRNTPRMALMWTCLGISGVSLLLSAAGITDPLIAKLHITDYLNIFNWCGFFAIGFAAQQLDEEVLAKGIRRLWIPAGVVWTVLLAAGYFVESRFGYFSWLGYGMELCSCILLLRLGIALAGSKWMCALGKYSFPIYLLHIQIVPVVAKFLGGHIVGVLISPVASYAVTFAGVWLAERICQWLRCPKIARYLLGTR